MLGGNSLDHPLVLPGQNKYLAVVTGDDVTGPHSTIYLHKQNITSLKMHENTISIVITWFANLTKFARVPTMYAIVVKMLTRGHAVIQIVHVQSMPFRHILWSEQRCYRLFETLRHAVVHVNIPAVLRLGICPFLRSPHLCAASNCMISLCERNHLRMVNVHPAELVR